MRFVGVLGAFCVAAFVLWSLPGLWQRAMVHEVRQVEDSPAPFALSASVDAPSVDGDEVVAAMNPKIDIDSKRFEQLGAESAARQQQIVVRNAEDQVPVN